LALTPAHREGSLRGESALSMNPLSRGSKLRSTRNAAITSSGARWVSFEGRGIMTLTRDLSGPITPDTLFVAALDRTPFALASGHGDTITLLEACPGRRDAT
jgi:hypothetical protein